MLWPAGIDGQFEWISALLGAAAFYALAKLKWGVITVICASAAIGLAIQILAAPL